MLSSKSIRFYQIVLLLVFSFFIYTYIYIYIYIYKFNSGFHSQTTPSSEQRQTGQETFLAPSSDKQTRSYDIECSNQIINYINHLLYIPAFYISQHLRGQFHGKNHCCSCIGKQESKIHVFTDFVKFFYQKFLNLILN